LSKKVSLIAPARIEFPGGASVQERGMCNECPYRDPVYSTIIRYKVLDMV